MGDITGSVPPGGRPNRRLAAIMFTDLVGYSALAHRDEALAIELLELHRGWVREIVPQHGGIEIETVGDAFLIEFAGALAAVECAMAIQQRFADYNAAAPDARRMQLRIGIHLGDIEHKDGKVMGDGVNIASRIHGMAEPGGICVSESVFQATLSRGSFRFESLGRPALKNIPTPMELHRVIVGSGGGDARAALSVPSRRAALPRRYAIGMAAVLAMAALSSGLWFVVRAPATSSSVAVLPFDNLSQDPESSNYFVDGVHDAVITHLAKVKELKVISRTSVMEYRGKARNLKDIGRQLGVDNIVEGTVQRTGDKVRVTAQLIKVANDQHLWAESYDRDVADIFSLQSAVAEQIVKNVRVAISPDVKRRIERQPAASPEAYDLYLRALGNIRHSWLSDSARRNAEVLLQKAIERSPGFAEAHAELAGVHMGQYWFGVDRSSSRRELARQSAENALRLAPDLAAAHRAMGTYYYQGFRDYERATAELKTALELDPNDAQSWQALGAIRRRQDQWDEALRLVEKGVELNPRAPGAWMDLGKTYQLMKRFRDAANSYDRQVALAPEDLSFRLDRALLDVFWKGDLAPIKAILAEEAPGADPDQDLTFARIGVAVYEGRFDEALTLLEEVPETSRPDPTNSKELNLVQLNAFRGDREGAVRAAAQARRHFEARIAAAPEESAGDYAQLGWVLAYLGEKDAAVKALDNARRLLPETRDAIWGRAVAQRAAQAYAWLGESDTALAELERLLGLPAGPWAAEVALDPIWQPLKKDPRFVKLVADHLSRD